MSDFGNDGLVGIKINNSLCYKCKHLYSDGQSCKAYPEGIPVEIIDGTIQHIHKYKNDNNIQYEVNKEVEKYE